MNAAHAILPIVFVGLLHGCSAPGEAEPAPAAIAVAPALDCPAERIATVTDLHMPGGLCDAAREKVGTNLKSHHYRVACEAVQRTRPERVEAVQAVDCREDDRGAWTDVEICCPVPAADAMPAPRRFRLEVVAPAVGQYGTASISLGAPPRLIEYRVRIAAESCDVYQLHPSRNCEFSGAYAPGETSTFMVRYTPGSNHRRGGVLIVDFLDPELSDVEIRLSGSVGDGESGWLSVPVAETLQVQR